MSKETTMTKKEQEREIERLRGELSAACLAISYLFHIFKFGGNDTFSAILSKFIASEVDSDTARILAEEDGIVLEDWIEGVNRFKYRLSKNLSNDIAN